MPDDTPDPAASALDPIRADLRTAADGGLLGIKAGDYLPAALARHCGDLLKAVEAGLKLADEWDAKAREIAAQITSQDTEGAVAGFKVIGVTRYQEGAKALREAITREIAGNCDDTTEAHHGMG